MLEKGRSLAQHLLLNVLLREMIVLWITFAYSGDLHTNSKMPHHRPHLRPASRKTIGFFVTTP